MVGDDEFTFIAFTLLSLVFCRASFSKCERFDPLFSCVVGPRPDRDTAVDREP